LAVVSTILTIVTALALGMASMERDCEIAHFDTEHGVTSRVFGQATAVLALVAPVLTGS
jgi:hypothetical protein